MLTNYLHETVPLDIPGRNAEQIETGIFPQHFIALGDRTQETMNRPGYLSYLYGSIERDDIPELQKKPKEKKARKSLGEGLGASTQAMVDDGRNDVHIPETGASLTEMLVESTMIQLREKYSIEDK